MSHQIWQLTTRLTDFIVDVAKADTLKRRLRLLELY